MARISLDDVAVDLPIYDGVQRSIKRHLLRASTGGMLRRTENNRVLVEALRGVTMRIVSGERVALIGRNGAGKSTLLRVMAGICEPTAGAIEVTGRIATLLESNSVMDPEMTGYENIEYAGTIIGVEPRRLRQLPREIEEFTELGDFLHLPIRTYSSGMMVRLSFAIATSIEPEILLLDEAIGAGDAHFVKKAKARFNDFYHKSDIVVMASHNAEMIEDFCTRAIWMERGRIVADGPAREVLDAYTAGADDPDAVEHVVANRATGTG
jgi:ABC-2 type transport system ATP-binding protein/lipopolysaccharide transport system ATP-binding protein